ncbi:MAG: hypothetical protein RML32_00595 [Gammaproteobacteria bacterium]|nr:hypothetical protein [Gammaproteobacteria bacterium]
MTPIPRSRRTLPLAIAIAAFSAGPLAAAQSSRPWAVTGHVARISAHRTWQNVVLSPFDPRFVDSYIVVGAVSRQLSDFYGGAIALELEGQLGYHFGDQSHWEVNLPLIARWQRFPWSARLRTSAAFGLGLSWATETPETEVRLESDSAPLLAYWVGELTFGPPRSAWDLSIRLHHRSKAFGVFAESGGMNAWAIGLRYRVGRRSETVR